MQQQNYTVQALVDLKQVMISVTAESLQGAIDKAEESVREKECFPEHENSCINVMNVNLT